MKRAIVMLSLSLGLLAFGARSLLAQVDFAEARGKVVDREGNPVGDALITFSPKSDPSKQYSGKTNKKGQYAISGLYTVQEREHWRVTVEAAGFLPSDVRVETRNVNRVLLGDVMNVKLKGGSNIPEFPMTKMGSATVDFTLAPEATVREEMRAAAPAAAPGSAEAQVGEARVPQKDPWAEALALVGTGSLEASLPLFEEAIEADPASAERRETHAKILYKLERYDDAIAVAEEARRLAPQSVSAAMVVYTANVGKRDFAAARSVLEKARALAPGDPRILEQEAYVAVELKDSGAAITAYRALTELDPGKAEAWLALGALYAEAGDMPRSAEAYKKVSELNPEGAYETFYNLGAILMNKPDHSEADARRAVEAFRKALEIKSDYAPALKQLGYALLEIGDQKGARQALDTYVTTNPGAPDAGQIKGLVAALKP